MSINKIIEFAKTGDRNITDLDLERGFPSKLKPARQWWNYLFNLYALKINEIIAFLGASIESTDEKIEAINNSRIGTVTQWLSILIPTDSIEIKGQTIFKSDYPKLFEVYGVSEDQFTLPDTRGEFVRGFDNGRGVDIDRVLGSSQTDMLKSHNHHLENESGESGTPDTGVALGSRTGGGSEATITTSTGGTETRPRNIAMIYIIKVK